MINFLSKFQYSQILIMWLIFIIPVMIIIFVAKPYIKTKSFIFGVGVGKRQIRNGENPHQNCPHREEIHILQMRTIEATTKAVSIDLKDKMNTIKGYVEEKLTIIKSFMINNYSVMLQPKIQESKNVTAHEDYNAYVFLVEHMLNRVIKDLVLSGIEQNGIERMTDREFEDYVSEKFKVFYTRGSEFMDAHYLGEKMLISREELREGVLKLSDKIFTECKDMFKVARNIALMKEQEKQSIWEELFNYSERIIGKPQIGG